MKRYALGLYEKAMPSVLTWEEKLETAKDAGYDFLEISIDESDEKISRLYMSREEMVRLRHTIEAVGLPIETMCLSAHHCNYRNGTHLAFPPQNGYRNGYRK